MRIPSIHRATLLKELHLNSKMPTDFTGTFYNVKCYSYPQKFWDEDNRPDRDKLREPPLIGEFTIKVRKGRKESKKTSFHRMFVICKCGREIPTGRIGQHRCDYFPPAEMLAAMKQREQYRNEYYRKMQEEADRERIEYLMNKVDSGAYDSTDNFKYDLGFSWGVSQKRSDKFQELVETHLSLPYRDLLKAVIRDYAVWVRQKGN